MPSTIASVLSTYSSPSGPSIRATSSVRPRAPGAASGAKKRAMRSNSPIGAAIAALVEIPGPEAMRQAIEHAVHEARLLARVERMRHVEILADGDAGRYVRPCHELVGAGAENGAQHRLEPGKRPIGREHAGNRTVEIVLPRRHAADDIGEEGGVDFAIVLPVDVAAETMLDELGDHRFRFRR